MPLEEITSGLINQKDKMRIILFLVLALLLNGCVGCGQDSLLGLHHTPIINKYGEKGTPCYEPYEILSKNTSY